MKTEDLHRLAEVANVGHSVQKGVIYAGDEADIWQPHENIAQAMEMLHKFCEDHGYYYCIFENPNADKSKFQRTTFVELVQIEAEEESSPHNGGYFRDSDKPIEECICLAVLKALGGGE
jgi:hypothetical protein